MLLQEEAKLTEYVASEQGAEVLVENAWLRGRDRFMTRRAAVLWAFFITLSFGLAAAWSDPPDDRPLPSPRTFVPLHSCGAEPPLRGGLLGVSGARLRVPRCIASARNSRAVRGRDDPAMPLSPHVVPDKTG